MTQLFYPDLESPRGLPYPDVLMRLLAEMAAALSVKLRREGGRLRTYRTRRRLRRLHDQLLELLDAPQEQSTTIIEECDRQRVLVHVLASPSYGRKTQPNAGMDLDTATCTKDASQRVGRAESIETKMQGLQRAVPEYRSVLDEAVTLLKGSRALLMLDDFYFVPQEHQPDVLGYLHQVVKGLLQETGLPAGAISSVVGSLYRQTALVLSHGKKRLPPMSDEEIC